jgi:hypothetical protein
LQKINTKIISCHTADSKQVKQEVNSTMILPPLVLPAQSLPHPKTLTLTKRGMNLFVKRVCHGIFHDILPKEYSGTFPEFLWGRCFSIK